MKIPIVFLFATAAVALANNLRGDEPVAAVSNDIELAVENSLPDEAEVLEPDSRELGTYSYHSRTGTGWGGSYTTRTKSRSSGRSSRRKKTTARSRSGRKKTTARSRSSGRKKTTVRSSRYGHKKTAARRSRSGRKKTTARASSRKWGGSTRKYKTTRKYGTRSRNRSSNRRSRTSDDCNTLFIVKSDSRRSTMTCAEDTAYEFRNDFDETVIATSDRQARAGDVVAVIDDDTDCEDLWDEIDKEVRNRHYDRTFYVYYGSRQKYYSYKKNRSSRRRSDKVTRNRSEKTTRTRSKRSESD